ncbi:hypothetical protein V4C53_02095 [Paraburkholderia azotifigens]|uniref:hypothetical protein n=1 Tax=Paraburkholderia azotifigens TaxID=2057004 RepID=UPI00316E34F2
MKREKSTHCPPIPGAGNDAWSFRGNTACALHASGHQHTADPWIPAQRGSTAAGEAGRSPAIKSGRADSGGHNAAGQNRHSDGSTLLVADTQFDLIRDPLREKIAAPQPDLRKATPSGLTGVTETLTDAQRVHAAMNGSSLVSGFSPTFGLDIIASNVERNRVLAQLAERPDHVRGEPCRNCRDAGSRPLNSGGGRHA